MNITANNAFCNNISFSGNISKECSAFFRRLKPEVIEDYFQRQGIHASFNGQKLPAGLSFLAARVARKLDIPLPSEFIVYKTFKSAEAQSWFLRDRKPHYARHISVEYDKSRFSSPISVYDRYMQTRRDDFGSTHVLNIPLHEIMHCELYRKIGDIFAYWHTKWDKVIMKKFSKINIKPFKAEIKEKIGSAVKNDALELHAVYWAKEICMSLNSDMMPTYNPFVTPKIELSPLLREFISKLSAGDYNGAVKVSKKAQKLQKTT